MATLALTLSLAWALGGLMHWWPLISAPARRRISIATNLAAVASLVAALRAEGLRESATTSIVLVAPAYHTATASASASLYWYVLTAACLTLGFAGFAFGEPLSRWLAPRYLLNSVAVAWMLTLVRFLLEKSAAPPLLAQAVGVTWMAPLAGAYMAVCMQATAPGLRALVRELVRYSLLVRGFVAAVGTAATALRLGTHYDVSPLTEVVLGPSGRVLTFTPGSPAQLLWLNLVPQLLFWPAFSVAAGLLGGLLALRVARRSGRARAAVAGPTAARD